MLLRLVVVSAPRHMVLTLLPIGISLRSVPLPYGNVVNHQQKARYARADQSGGRAKCRVFSTIYWFYPMDGTKCIRWSPMAALRL
jgi:hypothetical protein